MPTTNPNAPPANGESPKSPAPPTPVTESPHLESFRKLLLERRGSDAAMNEAMQFLCVHDLSVDAATLFELAGGDEALNGGEQNISCAKKTWGEWALSWCRRCYRLQQSHGAMPRHLTEPREGAPGEPTCHAFFHLRVRRARHLSNAPERARYRFNHHLAMGDAKAALAVLREFDVHATKDDCAIWPDFVRVHGLSADHPEAPRLEWVTPHVKP